MDASNVVGFLEGKRKQFAENGTLIPILVVAALVVIGIIVFMFTGSDSTNGDKPVSVVVNLNERRKVRRDSNDVVVTEEESKPKRKAKAKTPEVEIEDTPVDAESTDTDEEKPPVEE